MQKTYTVTVRFNCPEVKDEEQMRKYLAYSISEGAKSFCCAAKVLGIKEVN